MNENDQPNRPIRVLHIVGILRRGGIETWLMHVIRHVNRDRLAIDVLVQTDHPGDYDTEVQALGCNLLRCPIHRSHPLRYIRQFKQILQDHGPYDIMHSHVHHFSGLTLKLAHQAQVPVRIAHSHNDTSKIAPQTSWFQRMYIALMKQWIRQHATGGLAASKEAAQDLFGADWSQNQRWQVLYCGIDLSVFRQPQYQTKEQTTVRTELGIPPNALVLGHIGRFEAQKNHSFLLDIAAAVYQKNPNTYLLLIGEGPLQAKIKTQANQKHAEFSKQVIFAGTRSDIPRLMLSGIDVLVLPSLYEGLPVVGIEAQAASLPIVLSDVITPEMDAIPELVSRASLQTSTSIWASLILNARKKERDFGANFGINKLENSHFNIKSSVKNLEKFYKKSLTSLLL